MTETADRPSQTQIDKEWNGLFFGVQRSVRYHSRRIGFFDGWHRFTNAIGVIFGSATFFTLLNNLDPLYPAVAVAFVTVFSTVDLVIGTTVKARLHEALCRRFISLERHMELAPRPIDPEILSQCTADRLEIEADEPPVYRVLDIICHNELLIAMGGYGQKNLAPVRFYERWLSHLSNFGAQRIITAWQKQTVKS